MQTDDPGTRKRNSGAGGQWHNRKKHRRYVLEPGMTGFLCTCNFHERGCVTDAYKLLNLFANEEPTASEISELCKEPEVPASDEKGAEEDAKDEREEEDISTSLEKEIKQLRTLRETPVPLRQFQVVDTGVKNMIFIRSTLPNPLELVTRIVTKLDATKEQCTRYLLRLLPIELVCKAYLDDIRTKASSVFERYFAQEPKTFSIVFNRHSNNSIKKNEIIEDLAEIILQMNPGNKADLKNPEIAVVVEVIRGVCLISIAPSYYKFKKYNLLEICGSAKTKDAHISPDKTASPAHEETDVKSSDVPAASAEKEENSAPDASSENRASSDEQTAQA